MWRCGGRWVVGLWLPQSAARLLGQERSRHQELITNNLNSYAPRYVLRSATRAVLGELYLYLYSGAYALRRRCVETKSALARKSGVLPVNDLMEGGMTVCAAHFGSICRGRV